MIWLLAKHPFVLLVFALFAYMSQDNGQISHHASATETERTNVTVVYKSPPLNVTLTDKRSPCTAESKRPECYDPGYDPNAAKIEDDETLKELETMGQNN